MGGTQLDQSIPGVSACPESIPQPSGIWRRPRLISKHMKQSPPPPPLRFHMFLGDEKLLMLS